MVQKRWGEYLDWLSEADLITTYVNSHMSSDTGATLDELRQGQGGDAIPRGNTDVAKLFMRDFW